MASVLSPFVKFSLRKLGGCVSNINKPYYRSCRVFTCSLLRLHPPAINTTNSYFTVHWTQYNMACPGNKLRFDLQPGDLEKEANDLITQTKAVYDAVGALKPEEVTLENTVQVYNFNC